MTIRTLSKVRAIGRPAGRLRDLTAGGPAGRRWR